MVAAITNVKKSVDEVDKELKTYQAFPIYLNI